MIGSASSLLAGSSATVPVYAKWTAAFRAAASSSGIVIVIVFVASSVVVEADAEEEDEEDDEAADESELPPPLSSCSSRQRVSLELTYGDAADMMRECAETSAPPPTPPPIPPLPGRMSRSQSSGWLRRISSMRARSFAACPSHFTVVRLDGTGDEEKEEEEDPPALRFRPPRLAALPLAASA